MGWGFSDGRLWRTSSSGSGRLHGFIPASYTWLQIIITFFSSLNSQPKWLKPSNISSRAWDTVSNHFICYKVVEKQICNIYQFFFQQILVKYHLFLKISPVSPVPYASMTRLRSRTTSSSSISSFDGSRSRSHTNELLRVRTHSRGAEEKRGRSHTDVSMESFSTGNMCKTFSKSTEVTC